MSSSHVELCRKGDPEVINLILAISVVHGWKGASSSIRLATRWGRVASGIAEVGNCLVFTDTVSHSELDSSENQDCSDIPMQSAMGGKVRRMALLFKAGNNQRCNWVYIWILASFSSRKPRRLFSSSNSSSSLLGRPKPDT